jgi:hypothetical protein
MCPFWTRPACVSSPVSPRDRAFRVRRWQKNSVSPPQVPEPPANRGETEFFRSGDSKKLGLSPASTRTTGQQRRDRVFRIRRWQKNSVSPPKVPEPPANREETELFGSGDGKKTRSLPRKYPDHRPTEERPSFSDQVMAKKLGLSPESTRATGQQRRDRAFRIRRWQKNSVSPPKVPEPPPNRGETELFGSGDGKKTRSLPRKYPSHRPTEKRPSFSDQAMAKKLGLSPASTRATDQQRRVGIFKDKEMSL